MIEGGETLLSSWRDDLKNLLEHKDRLNVLTNHKDFLSALSKKLPTRYSDRITSIEPIVCDNSRIKILTHEIGEYLVQELMCYRENYKKVKVVTTPKNFNMERYRKEYTAFLEATDDELVEWYGK